MTTSTIDRVDLYAGLWAATVGPTLTDLTAPDTDHINAILDAVDLAVPDAAAWWTTVGHHGIKPPVVVALRRAWLHLQQHLPEAPDPFVIIDRHIDLESLR